MGGSTDKHNPPCKYKAAKRYFATPETIAQCGGKANRKRQIPERSKGEHQKPKQSPCRTSEAKFCQNPKQSKRSNALQRPKQLPNAVAKQTAIAQDTPSEARENTKNPNKARIKSLVVVSVQGEAIEAVLVHGD
jgi:hypothetical protein